MPLVIKPELSVEQVAAEAGFPRSSDFGWGNIGIRALLCKRSHPVLGFFVTGRLAPHAGLLGDGVRHLLRRRWLRVLDEVYGVVSEFLVRNACGHGQSGQKLAAGQVSGALG